MHEIEREVSTSASTMTELTWHKITGHFQQIKKDIFVNMLYKFSVDYLFNSVGRSTV